MKYKYTIKEEVQLVCFRERRKERTKEVGSDYSTRVSLEPPAW